MAANIVCLLIIGEYLMLKSLNALKFDDFFKFYQCLILLCMCVYVQSIESYTLLMYGTLCCMPFNKTDLYLSIVIDNNRYNKR